MNTDHDRSVEERLRAALSDRAAHIEPASGGLDRIEEKLMSSQNWTNRRWALTGLSAAAAVVLVVVGVIALNNGGDEDTAVTTATTTDSTTTLSTTTSTSMPTTSTTFSLAVDPFGVAYPSPATSQRFDAPEAAAQSYATEVLGFTDLVVGDFRAGDSRSGEVPVTDRAGGPETTVLVRQMGDDHWYVLGSTTADITVDTPSAGEAVMSPFSTSGTALAFEGTVDVVVLGHEDQTVLGEGFVTGSGTPPAGPFEGSIDFTAPSEDAPGIVVYRTASAEDGHIMQATSFPVRLQAG